MNVMALESLVGAALIVRGDAWAGVGLVLGGIGGWLVTPDADHHVITEEEKRWKDRPVVGPYMLEVWAGYGAKHEHRGRSHWHVWGTVSRMWYFARRFLADWLLLAYVTVVLIGGGSLDGSMLADLIPYLPDGPFFMALFLGWVIQDSVHIETDRVWSWWKSKKGRKARRRTMAAVFWLAVGLLVLWIFMNS